MSTHLTTRTRSIDRVRVVSVGAAAVAFGAALVVRDPHGDGSWAVCPSTLLGFYCPGCGSLRGIHDLLTGHVVESVGHNLLLIPALIWLAWWWVAKAGAAWDRSFTGPPDNARFAIGLLIVLPVFMVLRNLPGSPLAP
ncbi:hypothetical protein ASG90_04835 [Nocardioides sp. Soil797]|nr:hypothetical protein ASG90_04835 [Nocardioides sp. Soil797]